MFEGDDFPYWKARMESYLEAQNTLCLKTATQGFPKPKEGASPTPNEEQEK